MLAGTVVCTVRPGQMGFCYPSGQIPEMTPLLQLSRGSQAQQALVAFLSVWQVREIVSRAVSVICASHLGSTYISLCDIQAMPIPSVYQTSIHLLPLPRGMMTMEKLVVITT